MKTQTLVGMGILLAVAVAFSGCGGEKAGQKVAEKAMEKALSQDGKKVDVDLGKDGQSLSMKVQGAEAESESMDMNVSGDGKDSTMTIQTADGAMVMTTGANAKLPDDFPKDIPQYPGMKLDMVHAMGEAVSVQATTSDALDKVGAFYKKECVAQGWTEQMSMSQPGEEAMQMLTFEKSGRTLSLVASKEGDTVRISLTTAKQ
jgi:hypothetical protein